MSPNTRIKIIVLALLVIASGAIAWLASGWFGPRQPVLVPRAAVDQTMHPLRDPDHPTAVFMTPCDPPDGLRRKLAAYDAKRAGSLADSDSVLGMKNGAGIMSAEQLPKFVTCMTQGLDGKIWVGTETQGVFAYEPAKNAWKQFTPPDGLGQYQVYSVACDHQGRIWVGHLNRGVSVYDGQHWQNYDMLSGPLGERVFRIAVCPTDGDVWIATNAGLTRYSVSTNQWMTQPPKAAIPFNHTQAIAFDPKGNVYLGTQYDGIAMADSSDGYDTWRTVKGPDTLPLTTHGSGLPSNLINDVLVSRNGVVYAATDEGLARSRDRGGTWSYIRGKGRADKVKGMIGGPPPGWDDHATCILAEDYCTCLCEDGAGNLWIGHRAEGCEALVPKTNQVVYNWRGKSASGVHEYVSTLLDCPSLPMLMGRYPGAPIEAGVRFDHPTIPMTSPSTTAAVAGPIASPSSTTRPAIPQPIPIQRPTLTQMNQMLTRLANVAPAEAAQSPFAVTLDDDWRTRGDWIGRYGRYSAYPCASSHPEFVWNPGPNLIDYHSSISSAFAERDTLRHWVHWQYTTNPNSLELEPVFLDSRVVMHLTKRTVNRRQSEWDDHGEAYPIKIEGPNIYCRIDVPAGTFRLSLYDFNKDGHASLMRFRDYRVLIRGHGIANDSSDKALDETGAVLARSRIHEFAGGGVYVRFLIHGPGVYTFEIDRNYSQNAILAGVFLDLPDEFPPPYFCDLAGWKTARDQRGREREEELRRWSDPSHRFTSVSPASDLEAVDLLWDQLQRACLRNEIWAATASRPFFRELAVWYGHAALTNTDRAKVEANRRLATCYYRLDLYRQWEDCLKKMGLTPARSIENALRWDHVTDSYRGREFRVIRDVVEAREKTPKH